MVHQRRTIKSRRSLVSPSNYITKLHFQPVVPKQLVRTQRARWESTVYGVFKFAQDTPRARARFILKLLLHRDILTVCTVRSFANVLQNVDKNRFADTLRTKCHSSRSESFRNCTYLLSDRGIESLITLASGPMNVSSLRLRRATARRQ